MIASIVNKRAEGQDRKSTTTYAGVDSLLSRRRDEILGQQARPFLDGKCNRQESSVSMASTCYPVLDLGKPLVVFQASTLLLNL
jgi:hypothetical protein